ncbi:MAG: flagellar hook-associated protein FlgL [Bdellovibrionales bacterium]|nr:flagellar hook-associated protein FlgL [Bdellovibrionales bacterium]
MRIADNMTFDQVRLNLSKNRSEMNELQNQAATQKRVTKPSDDPVAAARVLATRVDLSGNNQFIKNLSYAKSFLEFTDQSLAELGENLMRVKELALSQANDASANEESRRVVSTEIQQIYSQMVSIANRKLGDRFIFGGYKTTQKPFDLKGNYAGDSGEMMIHTDKGAFIAMNLPGNQVFLGEGLGGDGVIHESTRQAVTVEELMDQRQEQEVMDQQKAEAKTRGQQMSPEQQEEMAQGTEVRGPANNDPQAEKMREMVNQSARPEAAADYNPDAGIVGPSSSQLSDVDKGINLFDVLKQLDVGLRTNDKALIQDLLDELDDSLQQVVMARAEVGSRSMSLDNALQTLHKATVDNQVNISEMEDADIFKTVSDINKNETTLKATLQTSGKIIQPSLLEFLR